MKQFLETFRPNAHKNVQWSALPFEMTTGESSRDDLLFCWIKLIGLGWPLSDTSMDGYAELLHQLLPAPKILYQPPREIVEAFHRQEVQTPQGSYPSHEVYDKICSCYSSFDKEEHVCPYTSVIGPSGIGKSFAVSQLAYRHGVYVVYITLAPEESSSYPARSVIASQLPNIDSRETKVCFWECFLVVTLLDAAMCQKSNISPAGFYHLQTMAEYSIYQEEVSRRVVNLYGKCKAVDHTNSQWNGVFRGELASLFNEASKLLKQWAAVLCENGHNRTTESVQAARADVRRCHPPWLNGIVAG